MLIFDIYFQPATVSHLQDEAPGDGDGVVVAQIESLKQLAVNRKHRQHDDNNNNKPFISTAAELQTSLKQQVGWTVHRAI